MARSNAEFVRRAFDAYEETQKQLRVGELPIGRPFAEDIIWDASEIRLPDLGDGVMHGREGVERFWQVWLSAWERVSFEYELHDAGDKVVVLIAQQNEGSQVNVPFRYAQIWTFEDGEVVHWKIYENLEEALEVAGLDPAIATNWNP